MKIIRLCQESINKTFGDLYYMGAESKNIYQNGVKTDDVYYLVKLASSTEGGQVEVRVQATFLPVLEALQFNAPVEIQEVEISARGQSSQGTDFASVAWTVNAGKILSKLPDNKHNQK